MATLQQLEQALVNAHAAGDTAAATKLAWALKNAKADKANLIPDAQVPGTAAEAPEPGVLDYALGAGEALLGGVTQAVGGAAGMLAGTVNGIGETVVDGKYGTQAGVRQAEARAARAMQAGAALGYQPRGEIGKAILEKAGELLAPLPPIMPGLAPVAPLAMPAARQAAAIAAPAVKAAAAPVVGAAKAVAAAPGKAMEAVGLRAPAQAAPAAPAAAPVATTPTYAPHAASGKTWAPGADGALEPVTREVVFKPDEAGVMRPAVIDQPRIIEANEVRPGTAAAAPEPAGGTLGSAGGTLGSAGAAGTDMAAQRIATAESMPVPPRLTKGTANRSDADQVRFEQETAKDPALGGPLRERFAQYSDAYRQSFDAWIDETGAQAVNPYAAGAVVDKAVRNKAELGKKRITAAYTRADEAGETMEAVPTAPIAAKLDEYVSAAGTAPIISAVRSELKRLGGAVDGPDGALVPGQMTLKDLDHLYKFIGRNTSQADDVAKYYAGKLKGAIDAATEGRGGELYKKARALRTEYRKEFEDHAVIADLLSNKRGSADRRVALEDMVDRVVWKSSRDDLVTARRTLLTAGDEGKQAWREIRGQVIARVRDEATKSVTRDINSNPIVSAAGLDRAIRALDADGKLEILFGKKGAEQARAINDLAKDLFTQPPGLVNHSNTASVLAGALDFMVFGATGMPVPLATGLRLAVKHVRDQKTRARINDALGLNKPPLQNPPVWMLRKAAGTSEGAGTAGARVAQIDTPEFKRWFGDSKVVDAEGKPLVVYHGTARNFEQFSPNAGAANSAYGVTQETVSMPGMFFAGVPAEAEYFGRMAAKGAEAEKALPAFEEYVSPLTGKLRRVELIHSTQAKQDAYDAAFPTGQNTIPTYLSLRNPKRLSYSDPYTTPRHVAADIEQAKAEGHDGVTIDGWNDSGVTGTQYVVFDPRQIKSAIGNRGTFDPADPSILRKAGPGTDASTTDLPAADAPLWGTKATEPIAPDARITTGQHGIDYILANSAHADYKEVAQQIAHLVRDIKIEVFDPAGRGPLRPLGMMGDASREAAYKELREGVADAVTLFNPKTGTPDSIILRGPADAAFTTESLLHELIHGATLKALHEPSNVKHLVQLKSMGKNAAAELRTAAKRLRAGGTPEMLNTAKMLEQIAKNTDGDPFEMITYGLTNPHAQFVLDGMGADGKFLSTVRTPAELMDLIAKGKPTTRKGNSLWQQISDIIRKVLGLTAARGTADMGGDIVTANRSIAAELVKSEMAGVKMAPAELRRILGELTAAPNQ